MAAIKVGVGEDEYNTFCSEFKSAQDSFVKQIETVKSKIEQVNCRDGGFYTDDLTPNVERLLNSIDTIRGSIEQLQNSENETIDSFVQAIDNIDTCC